MAASDYWRCVECKKVSTYDEFGCTSPKGIACPGERVRLYWLKRFFLLEPPLFHKPIPRKDTQ